MLPPPHPPPSCRLPLPPLAHASPLRSCVAQAVLGSDDPPTDENGFPGGQTRRAAGGGGCGGAKPWGIAHSHCAGILFLVLQQ